jgi:hypothetical protein
MKRIHLFFKFLLFSYLILISSSAISLAPTLEIFLNTVLNYLPYALVFGAIATFFLEWAENRRTQMTNKN